MAAQMQKVISNCEQCIQHEDSQSKASLQPIIFTVPLELLHVDFTSIETMIELDQPPNVITFWSFVTTLQNTLWHMWPQIKLQNLLLTFCGKDTVTVHEHANICPWHSFGAQIQPYANILHPIAIC